MAEPRFSVVIPTRQRANTLRHTLQTCLAQDFEDFEVVVCDNYSSAETRQVVEEAASDRVVYVRAPRPLAMSVNWERAVERARGEYITVLGDDDGLLPFALRALDDLASRHDVRAIRWDRGLYSWPCYPIPKDAHVLRFPIVRQAEWRDGHKQIAQVAQFKAAYESLPMIYNSVIRRDLIDELRQKVGRVFPSTSPDVYSGFACAYVARAYLSVSVPMNLAGLSGHSNGVANLVLDKESTVAEEFYRLNDLDSIRMHPLVPDLACNATAIADSFLSAKDQLFADNRDLTMDRRHMIGEILRSVMATSPADRHRARETIRNTIGQDRELLAWFDALPDPPPARRWSPQPDCFGNDGFLLSVRADRCGIANIADAVRFTANVLCLEAGQIKYDLPSVHQLLGDSPSVPKRVVREIRRVVHQGAKILRWPLGCAG